MIERHAVLKIECDECDKVETYYLEAGTPMHPEGWIQVNEGAPFYKNYDFCGPGCFMAWHQGPKQERVKKVYAKERARGNAVREKQLARPTPGPKMTKIKDVLLEEEPDGPAEPDVRGPASGDPGPVVPTGEPGSGASSPGRPD